MATIAARIEGSPPRSAATHVQSIIMLSANEAAWDRALRLGIGVVMLLVGWLGILPPPWDFALMIFAVYPLITGISGWCPLYVLLGCRTNHRSRFE